MSSRVSSGASALPLSARKAPTEEEKVAQKIEDVVLSFNFSAGIRDSNRVRCSMKGCRNRGYKDPMTCRCEKFICPAHQFSHHCTFDYKSVKQLDGGDARKRAKHVDHSFEGGGSAAC